jgi:DNA primase
MASVFISYRREDSSAEAGRLYDRLIAHFTPSDVFIDIDMIRPGDDFVDVLQEKILNADVMLVVIVRSWHSAKDGARKIRLKDPKDLVRLEVLAAMEKRVAIVPVLVGGATMPLASQLPPDLPSLTRLQAFELPHTGFHQATSRLIQEIDRLAKEKAEEARRAEEEHLAKERAEVAERAEQERLAKQKAEAARRAEQDKLAREKEEARHAERERFALRAKAPVAEAGTSRPSAAGPQLQSPQPGPQGMDRRQQRSIQSMG